MLIEDKASGQSLIEELLSSTRLPIKEVKLDSDKLTRAYAVTGMVEAGKVFPPGGATWLIDFLDETSSFPSASHDDITNSVTQARSYSHYRHY